MGAEKNPRKDFEKKVCITMSAGCDILRNDLSKMKKYLNGNGWNVSDEIENSDLVIASGCAYCTERENMFFDKLKEIQDKKLSGQEIIVYGCVSKIAPKRMKKTFTGKVFAPFQQSDLDKFFKAKSSISQVFSHDLFDLSSDVYNIKVGTGCLGQCSYCGIRFAKGKIKSVPISFIIQKFHEGFSKGYENFALLGDDIGCYGQDIKTNIAELLSTILSIDKNFFLSISDVDPRWLVKYFPSMRQIFADLRLTTILVPIQSGSEKILKLMKRKYKVQSVLDCVCKIKNLNRHIEIKTHLMCGFPGETENDWKATVEAAKYFDTVFAGKYWDRENTDASRMPDKISEEETDLRLNYMERSLSNYRNISLLASNDRPKDVRILSRN